MSSLVDLNNDRTDKGSWHSYLPLYDNILKRKKITAKNVLEVGVYGGGSIILWKDYFPYADVYGIDIVPYKEIPKDLYNFERIKIYPDTNAYKNIDYLPDIKFDFIIDDGSHLLEDMKKFIILYSPLLEKDGILMIEDVQSPDWFNELIESTPKELRQFIQTYDRRTEKCRYDDLVFVINKN